MEENMSVNSSSFDDILPSSSNSSLHPLACFRSKESIYILSAFSITYALLFPVLIHVLYLGYQQRRKQHSGSTATSHSDLFTYHSIAKQLNGFLGFIVFIFGGFINLKEMSHVGFSILVVTTFGEALLHLLTCVERYLAVVHPTTYRGLRQAAGVRIRNISIGCVWLLSLGFLVVSYVASPEFWSIFYKCIHVFLVIAISFCSIRVLRALKRPGPGEINGNRERVDHSKQRAFHTIMAIMAVLLLRFGGKLIVDVMYSSGVLRHRDICVMVMSILWFDLPSGWVLPLLFLHRAGKLPCCKRTTGSGGG